MTPRPQAVLTALILALSVMATPAQAQTAPDEPWSGLRFSRRRPARESRPRADFTVSLFEAYNAALTRATAPLSIDPQALGAFTGLSARLEYTQPVHAFAVEIRATSTVQRYSALHDFIAGVARGSVALSGPLGNRVRVRASHGLGYTPAYEIAVAGIDDSPPPAATPLTREAHYRQTSAGIDLALDRRSTLSIEGLAHQFAGIDSPRHLTTSGAVRYQRQLTRHASARAGYARRTADLAQARTIAHDLDIGIDYQRALSVSKRTTFTFGSGSSLVVAADRRKPFVSGRAQLDREIGRTWKATTNYAREIQFLDGFADPYLSDSAGVSVGGALGRRVDLQTTATYSVGLVGFGAGSRSLATGTASARLRVAMGRHVALDSEYVHHQSRVGGDVAIPALLARDLNGRRVAVGLTVWVPLAP